MKVVIFILIYNECNKEPPMAFHIYDIKDMIMAQI